ncbi:MAG: tail fiber domain-containing protein, partial [Candidatus Paceibacterota bacterium]
LILTGSTTAGSTTIGTLNVEGNTTLGDAGTDTITLHGVTTLDNSFSQTGANTFSTGTGAVSLNGATTITGANTFGTGTGIVTLNNVSTNISSLSPVIDLTTATTLSINTVTNRPVTFGTGTITIPNISATTLTSSGASTLGTGASLTNTFGTGTGAINTFGNATGTNAINGTTTILGTTLINSTGTLATTIGNATGALSLAGTTFALTSGSGLNITTLGALSGITTIATSSTINSQTISATASFTGSLTVAGALAADGGITFDSAADTVGAHTLSGTLDANTNIITNIGNAGTDFVVTTGALNLAGALTMAANANVVMTSGTGTFAQTYTGTTTTANTITANSLTTGTGLDVNTTNTATTNTALSAISFDIINAQSTLANTAGITGLAVNFTNNPTIAGNTGYAVRIQNQLTANITDNVVAALLLLDNADTVAGGTTIVTDAIKITNSGGANFTNFLETPTIDISAAGALSGITTIATSSTINSQTISAVASFTGTVTAATSFLAPTWDTATGVAMNIGTATQTGLTLGRVGATTAISGSTITAGSATTTAISLGNVTSNPTLTLLGTGLTTLGGGLTVTGAVTLTTDLGVASGGTGVSTFTANGVLYGNAATSVLVTAAGTTGQLLIASATGVPTFVSMISDATIVAGGALTLATVNANVGSFGSSTSIPTFTVNGKGLITAASGNAVIAPAGTLSGTTLNATVTGSSLTSVGTLTGLTMGGTLAVGANAITSTGTISSGLINGQTISSAANFTGTLNAASTITGSSFSGAGTGLTGTASSLTAGAISNFTVRIDRSDGNDYSLAGRTTGIYAIAGVGTNGPGESYLDLIHTTNSTDVAFQIAGGYVSDDMYFRGTSALQSGTGYTAWRRVLHDGNYNSYAPTLTGTGASGTWGISITGNADTVDTFHASQSTVANNVVVRDSGGYINTNYFNSTDDISAGTVTYLMGKFGDNYYRSATAAKVATFISGQTMNIAGSATTAGTVTTAAQPAITSVGTLTSLTVSGAITSGLINGQTISSAANFTGTLTVAGNLYPNASIYKTVAANDFYEIYTTGTSNDGALYISTGDDATEPIYVQQRMTYTPFTTRTLTLLDGSGNTSIPGNLTVSGTITSGLINGQTISSAASFTGTLTTAGLINATNYLQINSKYAIDGTDTYLRLNQQNSFTSGIYTPYSFRADGTIYTGGTTYYINGGDSNLNGLILGGGSSSNWATLDIGGSASINANGTIYSYSRICAGNASGTCDSASSGVVISPSGSNVYGSTYITGSGNSYFNGGNVGIGTVVPSGILSVTPTQYSTGTASQSLTTVTGVGTTFTSAMVGSQFVFANGTTAGTITAFGSITSLTVSTSQTVASQAYNIAYTGLQVATTGNVGIGTTGPGAKLEVMDGANVAFAGTGYRLALFNSTAASVADRPGIILGYDTTGGGIIAPATQAGTTNFLGFWTYNSGWAERVRITKEGNVGIGTTAPGSQLHVSTSTINLAQFVSSNADYSNVLFKSNVTQLNLNINSSTRTGNAYGGVIPHANLVAFDMGTSAGALIFANASTQPIAFLTNAVETMRIQDGKVGIGTTAPGVKLVVSNAGSANMFRVEQTTTTGDLYSQMEIKSGSRSGYLWMMNESATSYGGDGALNIYAATGPMLLYTAATERVRILANGNVGIGTTNPLSKLSINGGLHVGGDSDAGDNNLLVDGTTTLASTLSVAGYTYNGGNVETVENVAEYYADTTDTGILVIKIASPPNMMIDVEISAQGYGTIGDYHVRGYTYTGTSAWHMPEATVLNSDQTQTVRVASDAAGARYILLGTTGTNWGNYLHAAVDKVSVGYGDFGGTWSMYLTTSEVGFTDIQTVTPNAGMNIGGSAGSTTGNAATATNAYACSADSVCDVTNIQVASGGYVGLSGGTAYGIGVYSGNRNSGYFDTVESAGSTLELNYYTAGDVQIGPGSGAHNLNVPSGAITASGAITGGSIVAGQVTLASRLYMNTGTNLHLDSNAGGITYINYYGGTGGVNFCNGAMGCSASVSAAGLFTGSFSGSLSGNATGLSGSPNITVGTITSGLINGQTISSAANFTGTLNAATSISVGSVGVITQGGNDVYANIRVLRNTSSTLTDGMYIGYSGSGGPLRFFSNSGTTEFMTLSTAGNLNVTGTVTAPTFSGALSGNATSATTAGTANAVSFNSGLTTGSSPSFAGLGIGTTSPRTMQEISSYDGVATLRLTNNRTDDGAVATIGTIEFFRDETDLGASVRAKIVAYSNSKDAYDRNSELQFWTNNVGVVTQQMVIDEAGDVGIGVADPTYKLQVNGQPAANGYTAFTNYSDQRLKENIQELQTGFLDKILLLKPSTFNYNDLTGYDEETKARTITGFIAQDLQEVFPEMVGKTTVNGVEYLDTNLSTLPIYTIKAIQELNLKVNDLSSLDTTIATSLGSLIKNFLADVGNNVGDLYATVIHSDKVETKMLCVGSTCVTEEQFKQAFASAGDATNNSTTIEITTTIETCSDGILNQDETGIDTGGICEVPPTPPTCTDTQTLVDGVCTDTVQVLEAPTCTDTQTLVDGVCTDPAVVVEP